jgi:hypothetical protein
MLRQLDQDEAFNIMVRRFGEAKEMDVISLCEGGLRSCPAIVCSKSGRKLKVIMLTEETSKRIVDQFGSEAYEVELPQKPDVPPEKMVFWNFVKRQTIGDKSV